LSLTHRSLAPQEVTTEELVDVMWEVLRRLETSGVDVGPEASELLKRKQLFTEHTERKLVTE
jgi:hypothetical protein